MSTNKISMNGDELLNSKIPAYYVTVDANNHITLPETEFTENGKHPSSEFLIIPQNSSNYGQPLTMSFGSSGPNSPVMVKHNLGGAYVPMGINPTPNQNSSQSLWTLNNSEIYHIRYEVNEFIVTNKLTIDPNSLTGELPIELGGTNTNMSYFPDGYILTKQGETVSPIPQTTFAKSVNGVEPDANGDVELSMPNAGVPWKDIKDTGITDMHKLMAVGNYYYAPNGSSGVLPLTNLPSGFDTTHGFICIIPPAVTAFSTGYPSVSQDYYNGGRYIGSMVLVNAKNDGSLTPTSYNFYLNLSNQNVGQNAVTTPSLVTMDNTGRIVFSTPPNAGSLLQGTAIVSGYTDMNDFGVATATYNRLGTQELFPATNTTMVNNRPFPVGTGYIVTSTTTISPTATPYGVLLQVAYSLSTGQKASRIGTSTGSSFLPTTTTYTPWIYEQNSTTPA